MLGGAALLADGMITPPISITSCHRGLTEISTALGGRIDTYHCLYRNGHLWHLFFLQQFGTASIGKLFGPIMLCMVFHAGHPGCLAPV